MITPEQFKLHSPYSHQRCTIVEARTIFIMGDLDLHFQGHDFGLQGQHLASMLTPEQLKLHSPYLLQICIMVGTRTLFIMGDLDIHLQGHDLDTWLRAEAPLCGAVLY